ncbi:MAG: 6,7-dimethyl-8-ribityllumazine synthase [Chloroflexi bacterium]|nr:6,7-dimethyl-8-ribityllumazine synthase [Chloroflexota bacterium]MDE2702799.1 6,7-dimethyl-8-ribityllumazine synthase [Chloroflexota bacterium]MDE2863422.1 6,7-dimethyl-8-ribityllumazine synthase [Chloroflexota bacterium]MXW27464.1 6,7-dimethyl-8-ribityllumazine synthase [Chloroflexota bacterium]MXX66060.1 6,7-dimethyl-8-ribityllumazine synthase [Chloroflexota bacterium]
MALRGKIAVAVTDYHRRYTDKLLAGVRAGLGDGDPGFVLVEVEVFRAPGSFELPLLAKKLAASHAYAAVICLGCIIRSDTPHFDYVAAECSRGIMQAGLDTGVPVIFGVLTLDNEQQAIDRTHDDETNRGFEAAKAALMMIKTLNAGSKDHFTGHGWDH